MLSDNAKKQAFQDIRRLLKSGLINEDLTNIKYLKITPDANHRIVSLDWENTQTLNEDERAPFLNEMHKLIFKN